MSFWLCLSSPGPDGLSLTSASDSQVLLTMSRFWSPASEQPKCPSLPIPLVYPTISHLSPQVRWLYLNLDFGDSVDIRPNCKLSGFQTVSCCPRPFTDGWHSLNLIIGYIIEMLITFYSWKMETHKRIARGFSGENGADIQRSELLISRSGIHASPRLLAASAWLTDVSQLLPWPLRILQNGLMVFVFLPVLYSPYQVKLLSRHWAYLILSQV